MALLGQHIGRRQGGMNALAFSGALMCWGNPLLVEDAGFQLSFSATAGLMLLGDPMQTGFARAAGRVLPEVWANRLAGPVGEYFLMTMAAQVTTLPVIAFHFERISLISLLANPLILPIQPLVMILGGLAVLAGLFSPALGKILGMLVMPLLTYTIRCVQWLAGIPGNSLALTSSGWQEAALSLAALGVIILLMRVPAAQKWLKPAVLLTGAALVAGLLWRGALTAADGRLHLSVLPLESGSALLIQPPNGGMLLVNGAKNHTELSAAMGARLSPFERKLSGLVLTTRQDSALLGLPRTMERFPPQQVWVSTRLEQSRNLDEVRQAAAGLDVEIVDLLPGAALDLGAGARLELLVETSNGSALWLEWGKLRVLIPGEVKPLTLLRQERVQGGVGVLLLTAADLGADGPGEWLALGAQVVVWQTDPSTPPPAANWVNLGESGWLELTSDGERMWLTSER
jgi:competence protein ComEC